MEGTASGAENLLCEVGLREAGGPSQKGKGKCGESPFSSFVLASYFVVSQSSVMAQDLELAHLIKDSFVFFESPFRRHCDLAWVGCWHRCVRSTQ